MMKPSPDFVSILKQVRARSNAHAMAADHARNVDRWLKITTLVLSTAVSAVSVTSLVTLYLAVQAVVVGLSAAVTILNGVGVVLSSVDTVDAHTKAARRYDAIYTSLVAESLKIHTDKEYADVVKTTQDAIVDASQSAPILDPALELKAAAMFDTLVVTYSPKNV